MRLNIFFLSVRLLDSLLVRRADSWRAASLLYHAINQTIFINSCKNVTELFRAQKKGSPILIVPPEPASSHDLSGLQLFESALTFHFYISGFAHDFTFFFFSLAFLVIAFLLLPWARFLSALSSPAVAHAVIQHVGKNANTSIPFFPPSDPRSEASIMPLSGEAYQFLPPPFSGSLPLLSLYTTT
jgi:hypothetical protein